MSVLENQRKRAAFFDSYLAQQMFDNPARTEISGQGGSKAFKKITTHPRHKTSCIWLMKSSWP